MKKDFLLRRPDCPAGDERGWVLVTHGLNLRPSRMSEAEDIFLGLGYGVLRVILPGHEEDDPSGDWPEVSAELWRDTVRRCREEGLRLCKSDGSADGDGSRSAAVSRAVHAETSDGTAGPEGAKRAGTRSEGAACTGECGARPLYYCGFSLGGAAGIAEYAETLADGRVPGCRGVLLIAPAICLRPWTHLVRLAFPFPRLRLMSLAGERYEARRYTSVAAHRALFALRGKARDAVLAWGQDASGGRKLPVFLTYDRFDVLVAGRALVRKLAKCAGVALRHHRVRAQNLWGHLITDRRALGDEGWRRLQEEIRAFMEECERG